MATPFSRIYNSAVFKFKDYDYLDLDEDMRESILHNYLVSAQIEFQHFCNIEIETRNDDTKMYEETLDDECVEILATGIAYYWLSAKVLSSDKLCNQMNTKDYSFYSPANLLNSLKELKDDLYTEFRQKIKSYTYRNADLRYPNE